MQQKFHKRNINKKLEYFWKLELHYNDKSIYSSLIGKEINRDFSRNKIYYKQFWVIT